MNLAKSASVCFALLLIQACSHPIEIVGEGDVTSASGNRNCSLEQFRAADPVCSKNYVVGFDLAQLPALVPEDYVETYFPSSPNTGWYFDGWGAPYCKYATAPNYECSFSATAEQVRAFWGKTMPPLKALYVTQCGDTIVAGEEQCDDGNVIDGDACPATCAIPPPSNPYLADSIVPIPHGDSAQSDSVSLAGPTGPTRPLAADDLTYQHLGPGHFGIAISPEYPDGRRVIWSNGGDRISKLDYDTLAVLAEYTLPGKTLLSAATADAEIAQLDALSGEALALQGVVLSAKYLTGLAGVYYLLDVDNTLFVGGPTSILAYRDTDPSDPTSPIELAAEFQLPNTIGGSFVGANMTFDGHLVMPTSEGWLVVVKRDFSAYTAIQLPGAEGAAAYNQAQLASGKRPGTFEWVRNSVAVDVDGSIYAASLEHMHKVIWDGENLSTDPADGAWTEPYLNSTGVGTGATPTLMGFGDNDRFVVITDGENLMNVVLYWRDAIPAGWATVPGAPSNRIAGQLPADMDDPSLTEIQTEQSVVVGGYGALVVNNAPATIPAGFPSVGVRSLVGFSGADPLFAPSGIQKFSWNPTKKEFREAWATNSISSVNAVPQVSTGSNTVYTVGARNGDWTVEGIDWSTGESTFHWVTGSNRYNTLFSGMNLDQEGRIIHTTAFGIVRYDPL